MSAQVCLDRACPEPVPGATVADAPAEAVEVVKVVRGLESRGEDRVREVAVWLDLPERTVRWL